MIDLLLLAFSNTNNHQTKTQNTSKDQTDLVFATPVPCQTNKYSSLIKYQTRYFIICILYFSVYNV